ncbi:MAG TPA: TatD family hydrolase [Bacteroidia bacterium]
MEFIDSHTHLFAEEFDNDRLETINRAKQARLKYLLLPNIDETSIDALKSFSALDPSICLPMMGLHPCSVKENYKEVLDVIKNELFSGFKYFGVGEIGIDLFWDKSTKEFQEDAFKIQCEWAIELNMGVSIHTRSATYETIKVLKSMKAIPRGVFHCFTGSVEEANEILKLGMYLGIGGVLTFKNSGLSETLKHVPLDKIVLETDSPYLSPVPYRGKRNESAYIPLIAEKLAEVYEVSVERIAEVSTANAKAVFLLD